MGKGYLTKSLVISLLNVRLIMLTKSCKLHPIFATFYPDKKNVVSFESTLDKSITYFNQLVTLLTLGHFEPALYYVINLLVVLEHKKQKQKTKTNFFIIFIYYESSNILIMAHQHVEWDIV